MTKRWLATVVVGVLAAAGLSACGMVRDRTTESTVEAPFGADGAALAAMGFDVADPDAATKGLEVAGPDGAAAPVPRASADSGSTLERRERRALRVQLRKNTLHGEVVVKTRDGKTTTVVVQRGTVTAVTDTTITVKSEDGYILTWTYGDPLHVIEHRTSIKATDIAVGREVGVAGTKEFARLIILR